MISYLELWQPLGLLERKNLCNFGRRHYGELSCEIILNLNQRSFKEMFTDEQQMHNGQRQITIAHHEPLAQVS